MGINLPDFPAYGFVRKFPDVFKREGGLSNGKYQIPVIKRNSPYENQSFKRDRFFEALHQAKLLAC